MGFLFACLYLYFVVVLLLLLLLLLFLCVCVFRGWGEGRLLYLSSAYNNEVNMGVGYSGV